MNVSLTDELEKFVSAKVESGRYNSVSELFGRRCGFWKSTTRLARPSYSSSTRS